jgi:hypothetical protein
MKKCAACGEIFENNYNFCPVDGAPFGPAGSLAPVFRPTLLEEAHLSRRLAKEVTYLFEQMARAWPEFRRDPGLFTTTQLRSLGAHFKKALRRPYALRAAASALMAVLILVVAVSLLENRKSKGTSLSESEDPMESVLINFLPEAEKKTDPHRQRRGGTRRLTVAKANRILRLPAARAAAEAVCVNSFQHHRGNYRCLP